MFDYNELKDPTEYAQMKEALLGTAAVLEGQNLEQLAETYDTLLCLAFLERASRSSVKIDPFDTMAYMIDWLRSTDFYTAPASTQYHESHPGGLLLHSLKVYNKAMSLRALPEFKSVQLASLVIVALVHDWCKIGMYTTYQKNVKNEKTGAWEKKTAYKREQKGLTLGHGITSMYLINQFLPLNVDEALAIRWHMSHWDVSDVQVNELQASNENYPLVHLLQFADQLSITTYAN